MRIAASLAAFIVAVAPQIAAAADYSQPPLPPLPDAAPLPAEEFNWSGLYGGIHVNATTADFNFTNPVVQLARDAYYAHVAQDLATSFVRVPNNGSDQQNGLGGFFGYNWLWEDVVLGLEADFTHMKNPLNDTQTSFPIPDGRRRARGTFEDQVTYVGTARTQLSDYLILKARGGYAMGRFLPYASIGLVLARQRTQATYESTYEEWAIDATTGLRTGVAPNSQSQRNAYFNKVGYNYGAALGVGLDYALLDNVFLRAEYQHIAMNDFKSVRTSANTFRLGAAVKY